MSMNEQEVCEIAQDFKTKSLVQLVAEKPDGDDGYDPTIAHEIAHDVPSCPMRKNPATGKYPKTIWELLSLLQSNDARREFMANYNHRARFKAKTTPKVVNINSQRELTSV